MAHNDLNDQSKQDFNTNEHNTEDSTSHVGNLGGQQGRNQDHNMEQDSSEQSEPSNFSHEE